MSRFIISWVTLLSIAVGTLTAATTVCLAASPLETAGNVRWIVFASRQNVDEAIGMARRFSSEFGPPTVISTTNGWYAVAAGPLSVPDPSALKKRLSELWWAPKDFFFSKGQTFIEKVWESPKYSVLAEASDQRPWPRGQGEGPVAADDEDHLPDRR